MKKDKITFLKEKEIAKKAQNDASFLEAKFAQNPIKAKFLAFKNMKEKITIKDLF